MPGMAVATEARTGDGVGVAASVGGTGGVDVAVAGVAAAVDVAIADGTDGVDVDVADGAGVPPIG